MRYFQLNGNPIAGELQGCAATPLLQRHNSPYICCKTGIPGSLPAVSAAFARQLASLAPFQKRQQEPLRCRARTFPGTLPPEWGQQGSWPALKILGLNGTRLTGGSPPLHCPARVPPAPTNSTSCPCPCPPNPGSGVQSASGHPAPTRTRRAPANGVGNRGRLQIGRFVVRGQCSLFCGPSLTPFSSTCQSAADPHTVASTMQVICCSSTLPPAALQPSAAQQPDGRHPRQLGPAQQPAAPCGAARQPPAVWPHPLRPALLCVHR